MNKQQKYDKMHKSKYLTKEELIWDIKAYNKALLTDRKEAQRIRLAAGMTMYKFAKGKRELAYYSHEICEIMDVYISTFGFMNEGTPENPRGIISHVAFEAAEELRRMAPDGERKRNLTAKRLILESSRARQKAMRKGMYDKVNYDPNGKNEIIEDNQSPLPANEEVKTKRKSKSVLKSQTTELWKKFKKLFNKKSKASKSTPKSWRKYVVGGLTVAVVGIGVLFGLKSDKSNTKDNNKKGNVAEAKAVNPTMAQTNTRDTISWNDFISAQKKDTLNVKPALNLGKKQDSSYQSILQNKQQYYQNSNKSKGAEVDALKSVEKKQTSVKTTVKPTTVKKVAASKKVNVAKSVVNDSTATIDSLKTFTPTVGTLDTVRNDSLSFVGNDTLQVVVNDTLGGNGNDSISLDSAKVVMPDTLATDTLGVMFDSIDNRTNDTVVITADSLSSMNIDTIQSFAQKQLKHRDEEHHALTAEWADYLDRCDSILSVVMGGDNQRDSLYNQIESYIDSGNFTPTPEMHMHNFAAEVIRMSLSSKAEEREAADNILSGRRVTAKQQEAIDSLKPWDKSSLYIIDMMKVKCGLENKAPADSIKSDMPQNHGRKHQGYKKGNWCKAQTSVKSFKTQNGDIAKILNRAQSAGRLSHG